MQKQAAGVRRANSHLIYFYSINIVAHYALWQEGQTAKSIHSPVLEEKNIQELKSIFSLKTIKC